MECCQYFQVDKHGCNTNIKFEASLNMATRGFQWGSKNLFWPLILCYIFFCVICWNCESTNTAQVSMKTVVFCSNQSQIPVALNWSLECFGPEMCILILINAMAKSEIYGFNWSNMFRFRLQYVPRNIDGLAQDFSNSIAIVLELLQSCTKPAVCSWFSPCYGWKPTDLPVSLRLTSGALWHYGLRLYPL